MTPYSQNIQKLVDLSISQHRSAFTAFDWPKALPEDCLWMPEGLLSIAGTSHMQTLDAGVRRRLSKWESLNFYSMIVHGEKELIAEVMKRMHHPACRVESDYLHHFVSEETEHMWYFSKFCHAYGEGLMKDGRVDLGLREEGDVEDFLVFCRIMMFEELLDYFNMKIAGCDSVPPFIRALNAAHHQDESRHVAFGRRIIDRLYGELREKHSAARLDEVSDYLCAYMLSTLELFYSSEVYERAGIADASTFRKAVMTDAGRQVTHVDWLHRTFTFFQRIEAVRGTSLESAVQTYFTPRSVAPTVGDDRIATLTEWLKKNSRYDGEITLDLDIVAARVIDSLKFMQFIVLLENVSGRELALDEIDMNQLRTLRAISENFLTS